MSEEISWKPRWQTFEEMEEEFMREIGPIVGEDATRQWLVFLKICGERMPTPLEVVETYEALRPFFGKEGAKKIVNAMITMAGFKHGYYRIF